MKQAHQAYKKSMIINTLLGGFTLIEILVSFGIISIFSVGLLSLQTIISNNQSSVVESFATVEDANKITNTIIKELRSARSADNGVFSFETMDDNEIVFYSDIDFDGNTERVRYSVVGSNIEKGVIEPLGQPVQYLDETETVKVLSTNVRNDAQPTFTYYNSDWPVDQVNNPLVQNQRLSDTKSIKTTIIINTKTNDDKSNYTIESSVQIRLFKEAY